MMERNKILQGDVVEVTKALPDQSVNMILTSPPYWGLRDYGTGEWVGGDEGCDHVSGIIRTSDTASTLRNDGRENYETQVGEASANIKLQYPSICAKCGATRKDDQIGMEPTPEEYVAKLLVEVFRDLWRVLRDDGTCWINLGDSYQNKQLQGIPWRMALALQADGWYLRSDIIWNKLNPMPESVTDRPTKSHEYIFLLTKSAKYWYDADAIKEEATESSKERYKYGLKINKNSDPLDSRNGNMWKRTANGEKLGDVIKDTAGRNKRTVWSIASTPYKKAHFAAFPPKLIEPCILAGCPPRVCVQCGEPWVRVIEKGEPARMGGGSGNKLSSAVGPMNRNGQSQWDKNHMVLSNSTKTIGYVPTCQCCPLPANKSAHRPGIVLDPFLGSGTTAQVAIQNKRDWLGIELNPDYIKMAMDRIYGTQPALFAREVL